MAVRTIPIRAVFCLLGLLASATPAFAQATNYIVGSQDVLTISVFDQADLGGKFTVEADGTFTFPLIGRVKVGGLTLREVEFLLQKELSMGFFKNPQISAAVEQYRSQRVFIVGEVRSPGTYPLNGDMTLIEALARAGSATDRAGAEVLIVRPKANAGPVQGPQLPTDAQEAGTEVIHVDIKELQGGKLSQNARLQDNDTIFVPAAELIYVFGQVKAPGSFAIQRGMTVLQALSRAGGLTDRGASGRIRIVRTTGGRRAEIKAKLEDRVEAGDTIIVAERFF